MNNKIPKSAKVVVVGGGVAGCSVAYHLTEFGWKDVVLLERDQLTSGTTWHAAGLIGQLGSSATITRLRNYSLNLYKRLENETGLSTGLKQNGSLTVATTNERLEQLGIIRDGKYIFSEVGQNLFSNLDFTRDGILYESNSATGKSIEEKNKIADNAEKDFLGALQKLDGEDNKDLKDAIKDLFDAFEAPADNTVGTNSDFFYTNANGEVFELKIKLDPKSPKVAPRRFAVAIDESGVEILKGPKSFSSSTKVLLDELKFRLDNQLP